MRRRLLRWGRRHYRSFWWRQLRDPFRIGIVEILLRQTNAKTAEPHIRSFVKKYGTPRALAQAPVERLAVELQPLGLHLQRAQQLRAFGEALDGRDVVFPRSRQQLLSLPGIGAYATNAIRCFAFGYADPVVDVNLARIVQRVFGLDFQRGEPRKNREVARMAGQLLDGGQARRVNWALLDLGALVCTAARPKCDECPLTDLCAMNTSAA